MARIEIPYDEYEGLKERIKALEEENVKLRHEKELLDQKLQAKEDSDDGKGGFFTFFRKKRRNAVQ
jgi:regulator of replication initiation timing